MLSCKANARVKPAKTGHAHTLSNFCVVVCIVCFVLFSVLFVCICDGLSNKVSDLIRRLSEVLISVVKCSWVKCGEV